MLLPRVGSLPSRDTKRMLSSLGMKSAKKSGIGFGVEKYAMVWNGEKKGEGMEAGRKIGLGKRKMACIPSRLAALKELITKRKIK